MHTIIYEGLVFLQKIPLTHLITDLLTSRFVEREYQRRLAAGNETLRQRRARALLDPMAYARKPDLTPYNWPETVDGFLKVGDRWTTEYMVIAVDSPNLTHWSHPADRRRTPMFQELADIERWYFKMQGNGLIVSIGHFATKGWNREQGLGYSLARAFFVFLNERFGVRTIHFTEDSPQEGHVDFYNNLGTTYVAQHLYDPHCWIWHFENLDAFLTRTRRIRANN